ncbi:MAG: hypothetical protein WDN69_27820 [Aliidongia sp.]
MPALTPASIFRHVLPTPIWLPAILVIMGLTACATARADIPVAPVPFGGAAINDAGPDYDVSFNASFEADGDRVFFSRAKKDWSKIAIFTAQRTDDGWSAPQPMALGDAAARNTDPFVSPDGRLLYFASDRALPGQAAKPDQYHLWVALKQGSRWGAPQPLDGEIGPALAPAVTFAGELYFMRQDGAATSLFLAHLKAGQALDPTPLALAGAVAGQDETVSRDGKLLAFVARMEPAAKRSSLRGATRPAGARPRSCASATASRAPSRSAWRRTGRRSTSPPARAAPRRRSSRQA